MRGTSIRLLPVLIFVAMLAFSVRIAEVYIGVAQLSGVAFAEEAKESEKEKPSESPKKSDDTKDTEKSEKVAENIKNPDENKSNEKQGKSEDIGSPPVWRDASDSDDDAQSVKIEIMKEVSEKGKKLDELEKNLNVREALIKAASQELDRKYQELEKLKKEIEGLLGKQSEEEEKRIVSLVKIYEGMKPQDAARIFDTLDLDVLGAVMSKMSERKISPVLAAMSPERAKTVTIMLAEQKKLPELPQ